MYLAQFPQADALIEELAVVFLQFAIGLPEVVVLQVIVVASLGRGSLFLMTLPFQLRGFLEILENVDLSLRLMLAPVGLPA